MAGRSLASKPDIIRAIRNKHLFGSLSAFRNLTTWRAWLTWLKAVFALPMEADELEIFRLCTARNDPPKTEPNETYAVVGRRGGKSFISAVTGIFIGCFRDFREYLTTGEFGVV